MPRKRDKTTCRRCRGALPENAPFCPWCGEKQISEKNEIKVPKPRQLPSGSWFGRVTVEGQRVPVTQPTEAEYFAAARAIKAGMLEAAARPKALLLSTAIEKYIDSRRGSVSPATIAGYEKQARLYFQDLMRTDIHQITPDMIQIQIQVMLKKPGKGGKPLSAKTIQNEYGFIVSVLKYNGVNLDLSHISLPQKQASSYGILTDEEQARLIHAAVGDSCEIPILLALWLGLRRSEILALKKEDFDFIHGSVRISRAIVQDENGQYVEKGTKTAESARTLTVPAYILDKVRACPPGLIFRDHPNCIWKHLQYICERAGLPKIRLHDLRHINASVGLSLGLPDKYMMERGGWSNKDTMLYRYQHTYDAQKQATDAAINAHFEQLLAATPEQAHPPLVRKYRRKGNENGNVSKKMA